MIPSNSSMWCLDSFPTGESAFLLENIPIILGYIPSFSSWLIIPKSNSHPPIHPRSASWYRSISSLSIIIDYIMLYHAISCYIPKMFPFNFCWTSSPQGVHPGCGLGHRGAEGGQEKEGSRARSLKCDQKCETGDSSSNKNRISTKTFSNKGLAHKFVFLPWYQTYVANLPLWRVWTFCRPCFQAGSVVALPGHKEARIIQDGLERVHQVFQYVYSDDNNQYFNSFLRVWLFDFTFTLCW